MRMRTYFFTRTEIRGGERVALPGQYVQHHNKPPTLMTEAAFNRSALLTRIKNLEASGSDVSHERQALAAVEREEGPQRSQ